MSRREKRRGCWVVRRWEGVYLTSQWWVNKALRVWQSFTLQKGHIPNLLCYLSLSPFPLSVSFIFWNVSTRVNPRCLAEAGPCPRKHLRTGRVQEKAPWLTITAEASPSLSASFLFFLTIIYWGVGWVSVWSWYPTLGWQAGRGAKLKIAAETNTLAKRLEWNMSTPPPPSSSLLLSHPLSLFPSHSFSLVHSPCLPQSLPARRSLLSTCLSAFFALTKNSVSVCAVRVIWLHGINQGDLTAWGLAAVTLCVPTRGVSHSY